MYLVFFTKQNIGVSYIIGSILMQIFLNKPCAKTYIESIKQIIIMLALSLLTCGIFVINGNFMNFINYAFLGIFEFGTNNFAVEIVSMISYITITIIIIICSIFLYQKIDNKEQKRNIAIFLCIGIPIIGIIYPIINLFHLMMATLLMFILLMYLTHIVIKEFLTNKRIWTAIGVIILVYIIIGIQASIQVIKWNPFSEEYNHPYFGGYMSQEVKNKICTVNEYIKNQQGKVIILSKEAALYQIPEKRSNGAMDLPFLGNLGYGGETAMLEAIKEKQGYKILLTKENFWQESEKITNYIRQHYPKIGEIEEFEIYQLH